MMLFAFPLWQMNVLIYIANNKQFTICLRWVGRDLEDHENFIGLYQVNSITADSLTFHIKDALLRLNVQLSQCWGQCYDGTTNMSGIRSGVSTQIFKEEKQAVYTHCYAHANRRDFQAL